MNAHVAFNTHAFIKKVAAAGMPVEQAEALVEALSEAVVETAATKSDLRELELRLTNHIREAGSKLTLRMGAMVAATIAILGAMISLN
jgi:hypothetical protein